MSQFDFGNLESPLPGSVLINDNLEPWRDAVHSMHSGGTRPPYAVPGMMWINDTTNPWVLNIFQGSDDVAVGTIDTITLAFTPNGVSQAAGDISYNGTDSGLSANNVQDAIDESVADFGDFSERAEGFATAAQGTLADSALQPGDVSITKYFISSQQTITPAGLLTLAHGLGADPKFLQPFLICTTAANGYSVGDKIPVNHQLQFASGSVYNRGQSITFDATNIYIRFGSDGNSYDILNKTTGVAGNIVNSNYRFVIAAST